MPEATTIAIVGCGGISGEHVKGIKDLHARGCKDLEVTACCDLSEPRAKELAHAIGLFQGKTPCVFKDAESLIKARSAEAAIVCVPHCFHHSTAIPLLENGMHVLLEKPLGITIRAGRALLKAAEKKKRVLSTAHNTRRFLRARASVWAMTQKKYLGDLFAGHILAGGHSLSDYTKPSLKWRGLKLLTGGGPMIDTGAHFADMLIHIFGDVEEVWCSMETRDRRVIEGAPIIGSAPVDIEDTWQAFIRFKNGFKLAWSQSRFFHGPDVKVGGFFGTQGAIHSAHPIVKPFKNGGTISLADGRTLSPEEIEKEYLDQVSPEEKERCFPYGSQDTFAIEIWDFVDSIRRGRKPETDGYDGLKAEALPMSCYESATLGRPVAYQEVLDGTIDAYQKPINEYWKI